MRWSGCVGIPKVRATPTPFCWYCPSRLALGCLEPGWKEASLSRANSCGFSILTGFFVENVA